MIKAEKLSAIGTMASTIIHDIKNPMSAITSFAELLGEDDVNDADRKHFAKVILDETSRLISMTREILEFARGQTQLELKPCRIAEFINDIAIFLKRDFEGQNIHLVTRVDYQEEVVMDSDRIKRVIFNLSTNARDAMAGSGVTFTRDLPCRSGT